MHAAVDAGSDPDLATKLFGGTLLQVNCPACRMVSTVETPVVYHDRERRLFALVLPSAMRHRELDERTALLTLLARDKAHGVPSYVRDFAVCFGATELMRHLEAGAPARSAPPVEATPVNLPATPAFSPLLMPKGCLLYTSPSPRDS